MGYPLASVFHCFQTQVEQTCLIDSTIDWTAFRFEPCN